MSRKEKPDKTLPPTVSESSGIHRLPAQSLNRIENNKIVDVPVDSIIFDKADFVIEMFELRDIYHSMLNRVNDILREIRTIDKSYEGAFITNMNQDVVHFVVVFGVDGLKQEHVYYEIPVPHLGNRLTPERVGGRNFG